MNCKTYKMLVVALLLLFPICFFLYPTLRPPSMQTFTPTIVVEYDEGPFTHSIYEYSTGKKVSAIRLELYATIKYQGYLLSWDCSGTATWAIRWYGGGSTIVTITMPLSKSSTAPSTPPNNQPFVISSSTLQASELESILSNYLAPPVYYGYTLEIYVQVVTFTLTMKFIDGTKTASSSNLPTSTWGFVWTYP